MTTIDNNYPAADINYSAMLREIVADYFAQRISRVEYEARRRDILDLIDHEFNGDELSNGRKDPDDTLPAQGASPDITAVPPHSPEVDESCK